MLIYVFQSASDHALRPEREHNEQDTEIHEKEKKLGLLARTWERTGAPRSEVRARE